MKKSDITPSGRPDYIIPGPITVESNIPQDVLDKVKYKGDRVTSQGKTVSSFLAQRALIQFFTGEPLPIYEDYRGMSSEPGYNNLDTKIYGESFDGFITDPEDPDLWYLIIPKSPTSNPVIRREIREAAASRDITDRPIIMLVTSGLPHAIIYIFHEAKLYTCGYAYDDNENPFSNIKSELLLKKGKPNLARLFEKMKGAIYTADRLAPEETHEAKISWIGFLDTGMVDRIQEFLDNTEVSVFNGRKQGKKYKIAATSKLIVSDGYYTLAGILPSREAYNCLTWAQKILGVNINCGVLGTPKSCVGITEEQFTLFKAGMNHPNLPRIIEQIQRTLIAPAGVCTRIGEAMGICSTSKKGGKKKRKSRKGKGRSRKAKKTSKKRK
jgi:hypothetical protein